MKTREKSVTTATPRDNMTRWNQSPLFLIRLDAMCSRDEARRSDRLMFEPACRRAAQDTSTEQQEEDREDRKREKGEGLSPGSRTLYTAISRTCLFYREKMTVSLNAVLFFAPGPQSHDKTSKTIMFIATSAGGPCCRSSPSNS